MRFTQFGHQVPRRNSTITGPRSLISASEYSSSRFAAIKVKSGAESPALSVSVSVRILIATLEHQTQPNKMSESAKVLGLTLHLAYDFPGVFFEPQESFSAIMFSSLGRRSSWPSSFVTGLVGWISFSIIVPLAFGYAGQPWPLLKVAVVMAIAQILSLRLLFFPLQMQRGLLFGALWGALTGALLIWFGQRFFPLLHQRPILWLANGAYIGLAVGAFLSYFYRDDGEIEENARQQGVTPKYGRDAHWLEPFAFGALAYLLAFLPASPGLAFYVFIVGAFAGVFAAGASHFSPDRWKSSNLMLPLILAAGSLLGVVSSLLFRQFADQLRLDYRLMGAIAGFLTYLSTFLRGRSLARQEARA
jgi:hypothetical protein